MIETDFTKVFPRSAYNFEKFEDGKRYWSYTDAEAMYLIEAPSWQGPCVRNYLHDIYGNKGGAGLEDDGWKTEYCSPVKMLTPGCWIGLPPGEYVVALSPSIDPPSYAEQE